MLMVKVELPALNDVLKIVLIMNNWEKIDHDNEFPFLHQSLS